MRLSEENENLFAREKFKFNKSMVTNLCYLFTASASDREVKILISIGSNHTLVKKSNLEFLEMVLLLLSHIILLALTTRVKDIYYFWFIYMTFLRLLISFLLMILL